MKIRHLLQGRLFGHPIHPLLIHFPIAAFVMSMLLDFADMAGAGTWAGSASFMLIKIGLITGALAAAFGLADFQSIRRDSEAKRIAAQHAILNALALGIYGASFLVRYVEGPSVNIVSFVFSGVAFLTLMYSGYLGGELVYNHGIAVGRHRRHTADPHETLEVLDKAEYVPVFPQVELSDGQSRRLDVNGTVLVVARQGGELFAFQEFCTHRHGPLSEGTYADCEVMCPWHRSVFDMRTGEVKSGPAKQPIKVFPVRVGEGGMVEVKV